MKTLFFQARLSTERLKFAFRGRPDPDSAILLVGSGRSGTSWLSNLITASPGVQEIFEPLNPRWVKEARNLLDLSPSGPYNYLHYIRPDAHDLEWQTFIRKVLVGEVRSYWTDIARTSFFPDRFLIKSIRANLMIGFTYDCYHPQIIYITRHPCAVVHSRVARGWHADVSDIIMQEDLVEDYLSPWVDQIGAEKDLLGAHAVWWAVENAVALDQLSEREHMLVFYEELVLDPEKTVDRIREWLALKEPEYLQSEIDKPSRHSQRGPIYNSTADRLSYWQRQLRREEQERILDWSSRLGVDLYNHNILPQRLQQEISAKSTRID